MRIKTRGVNSVTVSETRLSEFFQAELVYFAQKTPQPVKLEEIVHASTPKRVVKLVTANLPALYAARIKHIESLAEWAQYPELVSLRTIFWESFLSLRLLEADPAKSSELMKLIFNIRVRHQKVLPLLSEALNKMYKAKGEAEHQALDDWAETFFESRISTEMLTAHCAAILDCAEHQESSSLHVGIVHMKCDPGEICAQAASQARELSIDASSGGEPKVLIELKKPIDKIEFSYIPMYLFYVVQELLRNSVRATLEAAKHKQDYAQRPIRMTVSADPSQVAVCISDRGGGIHYADRDRARSYAFSTLPESEAPTSDASPLSGRGFGLPLSRLYARYLGGKLEFMNVPGVGVDAYLFLKRIDLDGGLDAQS